MSNERKLTLEVIVDHDSTDWHWIYDSLKTAKKSINGLQVIGCGEGWDEAQGDEDPIDGEEPEEF